MTALSITPANVVAGANAKKLPGVAGATITAGQAVYRAAATGKFLLADADSATAEVRVVAGVALHGASDGQPLMIQTEGDINLGATLVVGTIYVLDSGPGGIAPHGDLSEGEYPTVIGVAFSASVLKMKLVAGGAPVPGA